MGPSAKRIAILITELMVFFIVTAFMAQFISHAGALQYAPGDKPPDRFPVVVYDGDRKLPDAKNYRVLPWSEWAAFAAKQPAASLLLPEPAGNLQLGKQGKALFTAMPDGESRQAVDLTWTADSTESQVRYVASATGIEPGYFRTLTSTTLLIAAAAGFIAGLFVGRTMRRRWLAQPGYFAPPPPTQE